MSLFIEVFPGKYACAAVNLVKQGYVLEYGGYGTAIQVCNRDGSRLQKYKLLSFRPGLTINPLYSFLIDRYNGGDANRDLGRNFGTTSGAIQGFNAGLRGAWWESSVMDEVFAMEVGYFFAKKIFGANFHYEILNLEAYNKTFDWKNFKFNPVEQARFMR